MNGEPFSERPPHVRSLDLFETPRLLARRLVMPDAEAMVSIYGDVETMRYVGSSVPLNLVDCRHWIEVTDENFFKRGYGMIAVCDRGTGELVGCAGIVHPASQIEPELKYAFRRDHWGIGLATEAVFGLLRFAFGEWGIERVWATVAPANEGSKRVLKKAGFEHFSDRQNDDATTTEVWVLPHGPQVGT